jgi:hypothetical protein
MNKQRTTIQTPGGSILSTAYTEEVRAKGVSEHNACNNFETFLKFSDIDDIVKFQVGCF